MKDSKKFFALLVVSLALSLVFTLPAFGQQKFVLKFNHVLGAKEPYHKGFNE
jgi:TRAP-type C4-dicarboxylate transport system substrate-binding protein